jgi:nucleotide-binding universal stress UspA family protein
MLELTLDSPFSKILLAMDHSDNSRRALEYTLKLAKIHGSKVTILHVVEPLPSAPDTQIAAHALDAVGEYDAQKFLDTIAERARTEYQIKPDVIWRVGHPAKIILEIAEHSIAADLIVMGSRGLGGFKEMLLGSVSHSVVNHAKIPVLIVR